MMLTISFTIKLFKRLLLLIDIIESNEIGVSGNADYEDETVKKSLLTPKNLNRAIDYLTPNSRLGFI